MGFLDIKQEKYYGEIKGGLFKKKVSVSMFFDTEGVSGTGARYDGNSFFETHYNIRYKNIRKLEILTIGKEECLAIWVGRYSFLTGSTVEIETYLPNIETPKKVIETIQKYTAEWEKEEEKRQEKEEIQKQELERIKLEEIRKLEEKKCFYEECYAFHIGNDDNPYYEIHKGNLELACIYIDKNKGLNFLGIDGNVLEDNNANIPFEKIHYYEKAGSIHYTTAINASNSSFGGSITGATISKTGTLIGGLLFGTMGMAAGAVLTHKPQKINLPETKFEITSETKTIDDRSVILNFYSDVKKQYIDIELPADIYNFLQTHLAEKKYDIVLEMEKKAAVDKQSFLLAATQVQTTKVTIKEDDMDAFDRKIKKLKMMFDNGLLTEEEFVQEKKRILEQI